MTDAPEPLTLANAMIAEIAAAPLPRAERLRRLYAVADTAEWAELLRIRRPARRAVGNVAQLTGYLSPLAL